MICWGLGAFGLGAHRRARNQHQGGYGRASQLSFCWAANLASQPNTARHLLAAKRRGAHVVTIDVRDTEAAAKSDEVLLIRPGTDAALALAMMHVICRSRAARRGISSRNTRSASSALAAHVQGVPARLGRRDHRYPARRRSSHWRAAMPRRGPAMIVLGGSSMHKGANGWQAGRAIACLPALTGNLGVAGGGFGPRHGSAATARPGQHLRPGRTPRAGHGHPQSDVGVIGGAARGARPHPVADGHEHAVIVRRCRRRGARDCTRTDLIVSHDLFLNDTARRFADVVLPGTAWLEELGCKMTHTHLYLMEQALAPAGETRSLYRVVSELAAQLDVRRLPPLGRRRRHGRRDSRSSVHRSRDGRLVAAEGGFVA